MNHHKPTQGLLIVVSILFSLLAVLHLQTTSLAQGSQAIYLPLVMNHYDPRWQWADAVPITLEPHPYNAPVSVIDHAGQFHIFWDTLTSGQRYIYHAWLTPTGWTTPAPIANSLGNSTILYTPVVGADGNIHILWHTYLGSAVENPYRLLYASFDGAHWSAAEEVYQDEREFEGMLRLDAQNNIHVTMTDTLIGSSIFKTVLTNIGWAPPVEIDPAHPVYDYWPDNEGGVHLYGYLYDYSDGYQVHYSHWRNGIFIISDQRTNGNLIGRQNQLDSTNILHTFWTGQVPAPGGTVNGVSYQCLDSDLNLGPIAILSGEKAISSSIQRAWDQEMQVGLAWKETDSGEVRVNTWSGCQPEGEGHIVPLSSEKDWDVSTFALKANPFKACVLAKIAYQYNYTAVCAGEK